MKIRVLLVALILACVAACFPESKRIAADASYAAQQMHCIDANETRETIDACRDAVKRAWASDDAGTDAARDGAK